MSKPNTAVEIDPKAMDIERMRIRCEEILKKHTKDRYSLKNVNAKTKAKPSHSAASAASAANDPLDNYPELKKFIEENEKHNDFDTKLMIESGCGKLERALFRAIAIQNVDFVENLIELGVDVNIKISSLPKVKKAENKDDFDAAAAFDHDAAFDFLDPDFDFAKEKENDKFSIEFSITPLYSALLSGSDLVFPDSESFTSPCGLTLRVTKKITYIILNLIRAGAIIDKPDLLGISRRVDSLEGETFLHRLVLMSCRNPNLAKLLELVLLSKPNLNHLNAEHDTPLGGILFYMFDKEKEADVIKENDLIKKVAWLLIKNGGHIYNHITDRNIALAGRFMDLKRITDRNMQNNKKVVNGKEANDFVVNETLNFINTIFQDMSFQALEYCAQHRNREFHDLPKLLLNFCHIGFRRIDGDDPSFSFLNRVNLLGAPPKNRNDQVSVDENIVNPALKNIEEYHAIGLSVVRGDFNCFQSKDTWEIIKSYCGHLPFINDVCRLGLHISLNDQSPQSIATLLNNTQIVPLPIASVISTLEWQSIAVAFPNTASGNYLPIIKDIGSAHHNLQQKTKDSKEHQEEIHSYTFSVFRQTGFYGLRILGMSIKPSLQKDSTIISFSTDGSEKHGAFLFLYRNKKLPQPLSLCFGSRGDARCIDLIDNPEIVDYEFKPFNVVPKQLDPNKYK